MKKILATLSSLTLSVTTATSLISCSGDGLKTPQPSLIVAKYEYKVFEAFYLEVDLQGIRNGNIKTNYPNNMEFFRLTNPNSDNPVYEVGANVSGDYIISLSGELRFIEYYGRFGLRQHRGVGEYREDFTNILIHIR